MPSRAVAATFAWAVVSTDANSVARAVFTPRRTFRRRWDPARSQTNRSAPMGPSSNLQEPIRTPRLTSGGFSLRRPARCRGQACRPLGHRGRVGRTPAGRPRQSLPLARMVGVAAPLTVGRSGSAHRAASCEGSHEVTSERRSRGGRTSSASSRVPFDESVDSSGCRTAGIRSCGRSSWFYCTGWAFMGRL